MVQGAESIALTSDGATTISGDAVQCLTAHYISHDWEMKNLLLGISKLNGKRLTETKYIRTLGLTPILCPQSHTLVFT